MSSQKEPDLDAHLNFTHDQTTDWSAMMDNKGFGSTELIGVSLLEIY